MLPSKDLENQDESRFSVTYKVTRHRLSKLATVCCPSPCPMSAPPPPRPGNDMIRVVVAGAHAADQRVRRGAPSRSCGGCTELMPKAALEIPRGARLAPALVILNEALDGLELEAGGITACFSRRPSECWVALVRRRVDHHRCGTL